MIFLIILLIGITFSTILTLGPSYTNCNGPSLITTSIFKLMTPLIFFIRLTIHFFTNIFANQ
jgi:hypothetical protein